MEWKCCTFYTHPFVSKLLHPAVKEGGLSHGSGHVARDVEVKVGHGADVASSPRIVCLRQSCGHRRHSFMQWLQMQSEMESGH
jgi:hypothetical protein